MDSDTLMLVMTTCGSDREAAALASSLVEARLAACASIGTPVRSIYPWRDAIEQETETPLTLKTTSGAFQRLRAALVSQHSYEVPEILALPVVEGHPAYLDWVRDWVDGAQSSQAETNAGNERPKQAPEK